MTPITGTCRRHRVALLDFVDRGDVSPSTGDALAHLDRCDRCTAELESTVLTITALRRLGDDVARLEPAPDAWPRLRVRIDRWRPRRWFVMSPTAGAVMSALLVAVIVGPLQIGSSDFAPAAVGAGERSPVSLEEQRVEAEYIARTRRARLDGDPAATQTFTVEAPGKVSVPRKYPDDIRPERKEVTPADPGGHPPEAI